MNDRDFLGVGWRFPVSADAASGKIRASEYEDDVAEAIRIILGTSKGERLMRPDFGTNLNAYVFESLSLSALSLISDEAKNSLVLWEPRIRDVEVTAVQNAENPARADITASYVIRATNSPYNLVFPFYIDEGEAGER
ncbi:MAG: GPW/gp25 family protein [Oscillospiraceae bacterium]|jgi:phage baseplate assembly protein W|nr:GPW/gp25 family protein [Oscillospiraceae bacterium]